MINNVQVQHKIEEKEELMAKFLGGMYRATIKVDGRVKRESVIADISELEMRKSLGYRYEFSFASDYNSLMLVANKIQQIGFMINIENGTVKITKKFVDEPLIIASTYAKSGNITLNTYFATFYKFIVWYFESTKK